MLHFSVRALFGVRVDLAQERSLQVGDGSEDTTSDDVTLTLFERQLGMADLPRGVGRSEVQVNALANTS